MKISKKDYLAHKLLSATLDIKNLTLGENRYNISTIIFKPKLEKAQEKQNIDIKISSTKDKNIEINKIENKNLVNSFSFNVSRTDFEQGKFDSLKNKIQECTACNLCRNRKKVVFGEGDPKKGIMIIGEGPGEEEDNQGKPFVGKAGQLLTLMLNSIGIDRDKVFITNVVKCRPPNNRNPQEDEIKKCSPFLMRQIDLINPKIIITLGNFATKFILKTEKGISSLRGTIIKMENRIVIPTYHPSFLLRKPIERINAWKDLQLIKITIDGTKQ